MNILLTDTNPAIAAQHHCDAHLRGMVVETAQLLANQWRIHEGSLGELLHSSPKGLNGYPYMHVLVGHGENHALPIIPKLTHPKSQMSVWVGQSLVNYMLTFDLFRALNLEYMHRFLRPHASQKWLKFLSQPPTGLLGDELTPMPYPKGYYGYGAITEVMQRYVVDRFANWSNTNYKMAKPRMAIWTNRQIPEFVLLKKDKIGSCLGIPR